MGDGEPVKKRVSSLKNFVAGGVAGACLLFAGHPLDTIKVTDSQKVYQFDPFINE